MMAKRPGPARRSRLATKHTLVLLILAMAAGGALYRTAAPFFKETAAPRSDAPRAGSHERYEDRVELIKVVDGDTLRVRRLGVQETVRLLRVDTPERGDRGFGEATAALASLVKGQSLYLKPEPGQELERDRYGRLLAYVFAGDVNVSLAMVQAGWSRFYTRYGEGAFALDFEAAEAGAQKRRAGLWALERGAGGDKSPH
jgi:endonuclease YncB( thermonuclease family)